MCDVLISCIMYKRTHNPHTCIPPYPYLYKHIGTNTSIYIPILLLKIKKRMFHANFRFHLIHIIYIYICTIYAITIVLFTIRIHFLYMREIYVYCVRENVLPEF